MPSVTELSAAYGNFMVSPRRGPGVCELCFNFTEGYARCFHCSRCEQWLDAVLPVSYSVAHEQLHHALASYKRAGGEVARLLSLGLAAVLWRHLGEHERCLAEASGVEGFDLVSTVPAGTRQRDTTQPLRRVVAQLMRPTRDRYQRLLERGPADVAPRRFDPGRFTALTALCGESVLLIDDTWTSGASAQSAGAALKAAGAGHVGMLVIGRHVHRDWHRNDERLRKLACPFPWNRCAFCDGDRTTRAQFTAPARARASEPLTTPLRS